MTLSAAQCDALRAVRDAQAHALYPRTLDALVAAGLLEGDVVEHRLTARGRVVAVLLGTVRDPVSLVTCRECGNTRKSRYWQRRGWGHDPRTIAWGMSGKPICIECGIKAHDAWAKAIREQREGVRA